MKTNALIDIYRVAKNWKGEVTSSFLGSYEVWLEQGAQYIFKTIDGVATPTYAGAGIVILWEELDLKECYFLYDSIRYQIHKPDIFRTNAGFHHMEFTYQ